MMKKAQFIVIEGLEGAGKTTAISTVLTVLKAHQITDVVQTREPGGTLIAEKLRALVKASHQGESLSDMSELLLMYAARVQLVDNKIKPALANNQWVLGDRHDLSSYAYQGYGRQLDKHILRSLKQMTLGEFKPDLTLYLDIDPAIGLERARGRGELDRIEQMDLSFFQRVREGYLEVVNRDPSMIKINANQPIDKVTQDIQQQLKLWLENRA